jgi:hypothetical protein
VCGCGHHYALHDEEQVCRGTDRQLVETGREGRRYVAQPCGCKRYSGPGPLPRYVSGD